ncbi:hypothetical protein LRQ20_03020 [Pseudomonas sp. MAFF 311096]|uniref:Uncharacterized protein n=2 Tax=Pseudomonas petroselini TaxID=2899822 RepID=A0ABS8QNT6_9PSED|nr:DUF6710 family protein [Pseudomonas petroselini]MCD7037316.1 hypothetical protein [Pseudomonas petroselini]MCD7047379.1 hypothetical protein [Pseudomonas petroselini]MCD7069319.1 hypothetical protein [Pseudomonas petroselini]
MRQAAVTPQSTNSLAKFNHLMNVANKIAEINPNGLYDLIRAILKPLQAEQLLGVAERGQDAVPLIEAGHFFGSAVRDHLFSEDGMKWMGVPQEKEMFVLHLSRDIVLPSPWSLNGYISALATIGSTKAGDMGVRGYRRSDYQGPWQQDANHRVEMWLPWKIAFVQGGNHSIAAGILAGEGEIIPDSVFDMSHLLGTLRCDGHSFFRIDNGDLVGSISDPRKAAVFEIGRLLSKT